MEVSDSEGLYDSLKRKADHVFPPRITVVRDTLMDRRMFSELMFHVLSYYAPTDSDNPLCSNHSSLYQEAFLQDQLWAFQMMDSSTTLTSGVLTGNLQGLGSFDECLAVDGPQGQFTGQLCLVQTNGILPPVVPNRNTSQFAIIPALPLDFSVAVCVPSSCSPADVAAHWQGVTSEFNASAIVTTTDCSIRDDTQPGFYAWVAITVLTALFILVIVSTWFDYHVGHQPNKEQRIFLSFSAYTNLQKLFNPSVRTDNLEVLDGIRVFAISWIVLGHRFEQSLLVPNFYLVNIEKYTTAWFMSPLPNMNLAVELFLLLSGCLLAYHFLRARARGERFSLTHFYYKRYIRLTPTLVMVMMLEGCLLLYVSDGPLWKRLAGRRVDCCHEFWWTNLLYISNYVNPFRTCILQSWYLSVDMQLYFLSPVLLLMMSRPSARGGLLLLSGCYVATTLAAWYNAFHLQLSAGVHVTLDKRAERNHGLEYALTHVRAASWLTGLALGYILHCHQSSSKTWSISRLKQAVCWVISLTMCLAAVFSVVPFQKLEHRYNPLADSLHIALHRNVFSLGAAGVILLSICTNNCGCVRQVLGWRGFRPMATLTYGVYLCHMGLQTISFARIRQPLFFDMYSLFTGFLSDLLLSNLMAVLLYISIEAPFSELGQWFYNTDKESRAVAEKSQPDHINLEDNKSSL